MNFYYGTSSFVTKFCNDLFCYETFGRKKIQYKTCLKVLEILKWILFSLLKVIYLLFVCKNIIISFFFQQMSEVKKVVKSLQYVVSLIRAETSDYDNRHCIM